MIRLEARALAVGFGLWAAHSVDIYQLLPIEQRESIDAGSSALNWSVDCIELLCISYLKFKTAMR